MSLTPNPVTEVIARASARWKSSPSFICAVALAVSFAAFGWTLNGYFIGDDFGYVGHFSDYPLAQWPRLFVHEWSDGIWGFGLHELRPITALSFITDSLVWGANPVGFRLTNLSLHAICSALVGLLAWRVSGRNTLCGIAAAVLFALHPAHAEPVTWITGRVDILPTAFYLTGFVAFLRHRERPHGGWLAILWGGYAAAAFAKEFGLTFPLMLFVADLFWLRTWRNWRRSDTWTPYAGLVAVVLLYRACRKAAFGGNTVGALMPDFFTAEFLVSVCRRQLTYLGHLFPPFNHWLQEGAPVIEHHAPALLGAVLLGAGVVSFAWWRFATRRAWPALGATLFFAFGWYLVATLPLSITYVSARHLYLASSGVCIALALAGHALLSSRKAFVVTLVGVASLMGYLLVGATRPWHNAALISRDLICEIRNVEREAAPGSALLLDVPEIVGGAYVWTFSVPFAVRPPFTRVRLDERLVVFENRGASLDWEHWHEQPAVAALAEVQAASWIIQGDRAGPVRRIAVPAEKLRAAAAHFAAGPKPPDGYVAWAMWRKLVDEASAP
jgi:hypothetical protein